LGQESFAGWQSCPFGRRLCGCLAIPRPRSLTQTKRLKHRSAEIGQAGDADVCAHRHTDNPNPLRKLRDSNRRNSKNLLLWTERKKGSSFWKALGTMMQGLRIGHDRQSLRRNSRDHLRRPLALRSTGSTMWFGRCACRIWQEAHAELGQFNDAWHCMGEAKRRALMETTKEKWVETEVNRIAGEIALLSLKRTMASESGGVLLSARLQSPVSNKQNPGNSAPQTSLARPLARTRASRRQARANCSLRFTGGLRKGFDTARF